MVRIGVTGLMGSGKSTVARRFQARGAQLVDGDALGWEVLRTKAVREAVAEAFGATVLDREGHVDRARLGRIVFPDPAALDRLNTIVQPALLKRVREILDEGGVGVRVLDAAMITTWGLESVLDGVVEIVASEETRVRRLKAARGFTDQEARERVRGQRLPLIRGAKRHWRLTNEADRDDLERRADQVWEEIESLKRD